VIEYLRLAFGTVVVLLPGVAVARALGQRSASATLAWGLACVFVAWAVVFTVHHSIHLAVAILALLTVAALLARRAHEPGSRFEPGSRVSRRARVTVWLFGIVLGGFLWHVEGAVVGDGLFHEGRVRKLVDLTSLHLRTVDEFKDGGLHPGYAFPLWHGFLALISWFSGVDPELVVRHEPSLLAPLACVVVFEAGTAVFGSSRLGIAVLAGQLALVCFGPGHGGAYSVLDLPATTGRQLMVPAAIALFFAARSWAGYATVAAMFGALTLTHPTYAVFVLAPLLAVAVWQWRAWLVAAVPTVLVLLWLRPIVDETISHNPSAGERARGLAHYGSQLVVSNDRHFRLAEEVFGRSGSVAVAALFLLPVIGLALRRRWAAFTLGGTLIILLLTLVPWLFVHVSDTVSLSQARRLAGFAPLPFVFAGSAALLARRAFAVPLALVAGVVLQRLWPGDFEAGLHHGGPALATWIALFGGALALAAGLAARRAPWREHHALGLAAVCAFVLPVFMHGVWHWSPDPKSDERAISPRLVHSLRTKVPKGAVVLAPVIVSYRVAASAPVYVVAAPVVHVANTKANDPYGRARAVHHWVLTNDPRVARRYGATWQIRNGRLTPISG
jgi:hypothetical protein